VWVVCARLRFSTLQLRSPRCRKFLCKCCSTWPPQQPAIPAKSSTKDYQLGSELPAGPGGAGMEGESESERVCLPSALPHDPCGSLFPLQGEVVLQRRDTTALCSSNTKMIIATSVLSNWVASDNRKLRAVAIQLPFPLSSDFLLKST
jgi:hypothetical protein